jgi:predicted Zn-dependent peptidase
MKLRNFKTPALVCCLFLLATAAGFAFDFASIEDDVTEFTLDNGLRVIVMERHNAPVASFVTFANVGGANDPKEYTGIAHMLEHMAFKGTKDLGTTDLEAEMEAMRVEDSIWHELRAERKKGDLADSARIAQLEVDFEKAIEEANQYVDANAIWRTYEEEGGVGLNAGTGMDMTVYFVNLPSNKAELWFAIESERFYRPVFREMYKERNVVAEERRMTLENSPISKLIDQLKSAAFTAHPYGVAIIGHMSDIQNYSRAAVRRHLEKYYVPSNMCIAIVGDVDPENLHKLAKKYWGRLPASPEPEELATVEPEQEGERRVYLEDPSQPFFAAAWHIPHDRHPDWPAVQAMVDYLGQGRTSLLYKDLVKEQKIAAQAGAFAGMPGSKYPSLAMVYAVPTTDATNEKCEEAVFNQVERMKEELLPEDEVEKIKARAKAQFIRGLTSNQGMAMQLAGYEVLSGDWRDMFNELDRINAVTAEDIQRVAKEYFTKKNRTVAYLQTTEE